MRFSFPRLKTDQDLIICEYSVEMTSMKAAGWGQFMGTKRRTNCGWRMTNSQPIPAPQSWASRTSHLPLPFSRKMVPQNYRQEKREEKTNDGHLCLCPPLIIITTIQSTLTLVSFSSLGIIPFSLQHLGGAFNLETLSDSCQVVAFSRLNKKGNKRKKKSDKTFWRDLCTQEAGQNPSRKSCSSLSLWI